MTDCEFGDVVLVPFPFTDQTTTKQRPAVVISSAAYHRERSAVTSQLRPVMQTGEAPIVDWKNAGLLKPSVVKPVIATIDRQLVRKRLGHLASADTTALIRALSAIIGA